MFKLATYLRISTNILPTLASEWRTFFWKQLVELFCVTAGVRAHEHHLDFTVEVSEKMELCESLCLLENC